MTLRDRINNHKYRTKVATTIWGVVAFGATLLAAGLKVHLLWAVATVAYALFGYYHIWRSSHGVLCPGCGNQICAYVPFPVPVKVRCCPCCGYDLDAPLPEGQTPGK